MGQDTHFHGKLEFTRELSASEIDTLRDVLSPFRPLTVMDDQRGLRYCSEKTYYMVGEVNSIIEDARKVIPDFGLKGKLAADTDFEPHFWFVKIDDDGRACAEPSTRAEFLAFRRTVYPDGYRGYGALDDDDPRMKAFKESQEPTRLDRARGMVKTALSHLKQ